VCACACAHRRDKMEEDKIEKELKEYIKKYIIATELIRNFEAVSQFVEQIKTIRLNNVVRYISIMYNIEQKDVWNEVKFLIRTYKSNYREYVEYKNRIEKIINHLKATENI